MLKKKQIKHRSFKQTMRLLRAAPLASQETQGRQMKPTVFQLLPFFEADDRASATADGYPYHPWIKMQNASWSAKSMSKLKKVDPDMIHVYLITYIYI